MAPQGSSQNSPDPVQQCLPSPQITTRSATSAAELAQQAEEQYEEFAEERAGRRRAHRKTVWDSTLDLQRHQPVDDSLLREMLEELEQEKYRAFGGAVSSRSTGTLGGRPASAPAGRRPQSATQPTFGAPLGIAAEQRPQSAPMGQRCQRPKQSPQRRRDLRSFTAPLGCRQVPSAKVGDRPPGVPPPRSPSAPRLLDGGGLLEKRPHRVSFLQEIEDSAVRHTIGKFKRERLAEKEAVSHIDIMHDTTLFDLKVLHNPAARKRTDKKRRDSPPRAETTRKGRNAARAAYKIGPRHPQWRNLAAVDQMRNLRIVMDMENRVQKGVLNSDAKPQGKTKAQEAGGEKTLLHGPEDAAAGDEDPSQKPHQNLFANFNIDEQPEKHCKPTAMAAIMQNPELARATVNLLDFMLSRMDTVKWDGSLSDFVGLLDVRKRGKISRQEWETGLMALGYPDNRGAVIVGSHDDPARFFRALESDSSSELLCEDLVMALEMHRPAVVERWEKDQSLRETRLGTDIVDVARAKREIATSLPRDRGSIRQPANLEKGRDTLQEDPFASPAPAWSPSESEISASES